MENNNLNFNNLRKDYWTPENPTNASAQPSNMGTYRSKAGSWGNAKSEMSHTMFSSNFLKISYITVDNGNEGYVVYGDNGDLNSDSKIDIRDAMSSLRHVSGREDLDCVREGFALYIPDTLL